MKIGNRQQLLLTVTVAVVALFAGDKLIYTPLTNLWRARAGEITKLHGDVKRAEATIRIERAIRGQWDEMRTNTLPNNQSAAL